MEGGELGVRIRLRLRGDGKDDDNSDARYDGMAIIGCIERCVTSFSCGVHWKVLVG